MQTIFEDVKFRSIQRPAAIASSADSAAVGIVDGNQDMAVRVNVGAITGTTVVNTVSIQTAPAASGPWTTQLTFVINNAQANMSRVQRLPVVPGALFVRSSEVVSGDTPSILRAIDLMNVPRRHGASTNSAIFAA